MRRWRSAVTSVLTVVAVVGLGSAAGLAQGKGDAKKGAELYAANKCATCHGERGAGDGAMGQKLKDKPSDWRAGGGGLKGMDDAKIFESIKRGGGAVGKSRAMPAYGKLSDDQVSDLVAYVKSLAK